MKKLAILCCITSLFTAKARATDTMLQVSTTEGNTYSYLFSSNPRILPDGNSISIVSDGANVLVLDITQIVKFTTCENNNESIKSLAFDSPIISINDNILSVTGAKDPIMVYSISGELLSRSESGDTEIILPHSATYIIKIGAYSFKATR